MPEAKSFHIGFFAFAKEKNVRRCLPTSYGLKNRRAYFKNEDTSMFLKAPERE